MFARGVERRGGVLIAPICLVGGTEWASERFADRPVAASHGWRVAWEPAIGVTAALTVASVAREG